MYTESYGDYTIRHNNRVDVRERQNHDIARVALRKTARGNRREVNRRHRELNNKGLAIMKEQIISSFTEIPSTDSALRDLALDRLQEIAELVIDQPD